VIDGVVVVPLRRLVDERGTISHMLRADDPHFRGFGEIYFSSIHPGVVKGWHRHEPAWLNYACVAGTIKLVLYDERDGSPTRGALLELFLGQDDHKLVQIPPGVWNGFKAVGPHSALVANCCTHAHGTFRSERLPPFQNHIPYDWAAKSH
jgi:dTDP-4-dehydrorhamnose 3,5-epimerase